MDNNLWSVEKLAAEAATGKLAIWMKWGRPVNLIVIPEKVGIVEIRTDRTRNRPGGGVQPAGPRVLPPRAFRSR